MRGFIDLHSHWVAAIDDGARTIDDSRALLTALRGAGFDVVVATPHMRPGMFDNDKAALEQAYLKTRAALDGSKDLPTLHLASEHYFDSTVFDRLMARACLPYPGGHAVLVELPTRDFPLNLALRFSELKRSGLRPVLAHPERYAPVWKKASVLDPLLDAGTLMLLDTAALVGKYGRAPQKAAEELLEQGYYYAACSDAHAARDVDDVRAGIEILYEREGDEQANWLLRDGPKTILDGNIDAP
jgi:protein-tyrosine phosphatase